MILNQFDKTSTAVINPEHFYEPVKGFPKIVVSCFAAQTFERLVRTLNAEQIDAVGNANGKKPVYKATYQGLELALYMSFVGAPAAVAALEELRVKGAQKFVIFGTCGVLDDAIDDCQIIVPTAALRDEGTSYHYAPSAPQIAVNQKYGDLFRRLLKQRDIDYVAGKVWTTDAFYRETAQKVAARKSAGCICVDMECAAIAAFAQFRGVDLLHFFYAADNLAAADWQSRSLSNVAALDKKDAVANLALAAALAIAKEQ